MKVFTPSGYQKVSQAGGGGGTTFSAGVSTLGNTAGTTGIVTDRVVFVGSNNITLSQSVNAGSATISILGGGGVNFSAGTTSNNLSAITFSNANNVSFGLDGSTITGSVSTSLTNIRVSAGTASNYLSAITFSNANNFSFGLDGSTVTGSYTVPTVTNSSWTVSDNGTSGTVARLAFTNLNGVTLSLSTGAGGSHTIVGSHNALTSQSNQALSAPNGSFTFQTAQFHNSNGISWSTTTGSGIVASHNGITSQSNQQMTLFATGNTTQSSTGTSNASSLIFRGSGAASVGITNGSVLIDVAAGAAAITQSIGISTQTAGGSTAGTSGYATGDDILYHFVPGTGITMSQSLDGASATLSVHGAESSPIASTYINMPYMMNTQTQTLSNSLSYCFPFIVQDDKISFNFAQKQWSIAFTSTSFASTANTSYSYNLAHTHQFVVYTKGTGASSLSLVSVGSTSVGFTHSIRLSRNTTNNISVTHGITFPSGVGTESTSFSYAATNSSDQFSTTGLSALTGIKNWATSFASSLSRNQYYWMEGYSSNQTTQQTAALSNARLRLSHIYVTQPAIVVAPFATAPNAALFPHNFGPGSFSTAGGATTSILPIVNLSSSASHPVAWLALEMLV